jgi:multidrug resistance efflux pump
LAKEQGTMTVRDRGVMWASTRRCEARRAAILLLSLVATVAGCRTGPDTTRPGRAPAAQETPAALRFTGTVEAALVRTVTVPRLQGPIVPMLVVGLVKAGTRVEAGDLLVEFDRQQQEREAFDRHAELVNLDGEIAKKRSDQAAAEAKDAAELAAATHDVARAELEVKKNDLIARVEAEKNRLALEQAQARLAQLHTTYKLKREAAAADLRILEIRRERSQRALDYARQNAQLMQVRAPFAGLAVIKRVYRNGQFVEMAAGDEVRPGTPIVDIVDTSVMLVRARLNQADYRLVQPGQSAKVGLDGFPDLVFDGRVEQIAPLATSSQLSATVRTFTAVVSIRGTHPQLLPDLTAWVEVGEAPIATAQRVAGGSPAAGSAPQAPAAASEERRR